MSKTKPAILNRPATLWAVEKPWEKRPKDKAGGISRAFALKTRADSLRSMAEGWRPPSVVGGSKYETVEQNATVLGGIRALRLAGVEPWTGVKTGQVPELSMSGGGSKRNKTSPALVTIVQRAARQAGSKTKIDSIDAAAKYIRRIVKNARLGKVAWAARAKLITQLSVRRLKLRGAADTGTATAIQATAMGLHAGAGVADATVVGLVVGIPVHIVAGALNVTGAVMTASSGRTSVELTRAKAAVTKFGSMVQNGLEERGLKMAARQAAAEARDQLSQTEAETSSLMAQGQVQAERQQQIIKVTAVVGVLGVFSALAYLVVRRRGN
jgi:hypothetical protein